jgi:hypothetical protein
MWLLFYLFCKTTLYEELVEGLDYSICGVFIRVIIIPLLFVASFEKRANTLQYEQGDMSVSLDSE